MTAFVLLVVLSGPPLPSDSTLQLRLHLGRDFASRVIRSELSRNGPYFLSKRLAIERHYRIVVDDDANLEPTYQIGRGGERLRFRQGTFAASGTFIRHLAHLCAVNLWERRNPFLEGGVWAEEPDIPDWRMGEYREHMSGRPEEYPTRMFEDEP